MVRLTAPSSGEGDRVITVNLHMDCKSKRENKI